MAELGLTDFADYLKRLRRDGDEAAGLGDRMRVTVSRFFRERERWELLRKRVLPRLLSEKAEGDPLRIWSAGCCGGEEPYSLALLWLEYFRPQNPDRSVEILATDIDRRSLDRAERAVYGGGAVREVPPQILERYFQPEGKLWRLDERVKRLVSFRRRNVEEAPPPSGMDLVCCRYLAFTYFRGNRRLAAARRLRQALRPEGILMIGRKEELEEASGLFDSCPEAPGFFVRERDPGPA